MTYSETPFIRRSFKNLSRIDLTLDPSEEVRCKARFRPIIQRYGNQTKFNYTELEILLIIYYKLTKDQPLDMKYFRRLMFKMFDFSNDVLMDRIFSAFARNNKRVITMDSWIIGMSIFLRGDLNERIRFCFSVYDLMGNGFIKKEVMFFFLRKTIRSVSRDEDLEDTVWDILGILLKKMDRDMDGRISFNDYKESVWQNESLLEFMGYCLPSRPAVYTFMSTFTPNVTTAHTRYYHRKNSSLKGHK